MQSELGGCETPPALMSGNHQIDVSGHGRGRHWLQPSQLQQQLGNLKNKEPEHILICVDIVTCEKIMGRLLLNDLTL